MHLKSAARCRPAYFTVNFTWSMVSFSRRVICNFPTKIESLLLALSKYHKFDHKFLQTSRNSWWNFACRMYLRHKNNCSIVILAQKIQEFVWYVYHALKFAFASFLSKIRQSLTFKQAGKLYFLTKYNTCSRSSILHNFSISSM